MASTATQAQLSLYKRIRRKLRRIKRLTVGYIHNMSAYKAYRQWRHHITGPLRMARAELKREEHRQQKAQQQQEQPNLWDRRIPSVEFLPLYLEQESIEAHPTPQMQAIPLPICGGSPVTVERPGDLVRHYHQQHLAEAETNRIGIRPIRHLQHLIEPEVLPDQVGVTAKEAEFLLDQHFARVEEDPDVTIKREAVQKGDGHA